MSRHSGNRKSAMVLLCVLVCLLVALFLIALSIRAARDPSSEIGNPECGAAVASESVLDHEVEDPELMGDRQQLPVARHEVLWKLTASEQADLTGHGVGAVCGLGDDDRLQKNLVGWRWLVAAPFDVVDGE